MTTATYRPTVAAAHAIAAALAGTEFSARIWEGDGGKVRVYISRGNQQEGYIGYRAGVITSFGRSYVIDARVNYLLSERIAAPAIEAFSRAVSS